MKIEMFRFQNAVKLIRFCILQVVLALVLLLPAAHANEKKSFTIVYASDWPPISYGVGTEVDGILPRLMDRIFSGNSNIEIVRHGLPWERAQKVFFRGKVDGMVTTPTQKRLQYSSQSSEIAIEIPFHPIVRRDSELAKRISQDKSLNNLKNYRYCDVLGNGWAEEFYDSVGINYSTAPTIEHCLQQLKLNRVDIVIHAKSVLEIFSKKLGLDDDLEVVDQKFGESHKFPLLISNKFANSPEVMQFFDEKVSHLKADGRYSAIMNDIVGAERDKVEPGELIN
jgi:polar amino acid transport system substrate-binding protein